MFYFRPTSIYKEQFFYNTYYNNNTKNEIISK